MRFRVGVVHPSVLHDKSRSSQLKLEHLLEWLEGFYLLHCDGDWEHSYGFSISSVDNPGWYVKLDLADTRLSLVPFVEVKEQRSDLDWVFCRKDTDQFVGAGGPRNLVEILSIFREWAEKNSDPDISPWVPSGNGR